jgi:hypothetical protein
MRKGVWRWEEYARRPALPSGAATASRSKPGRLAYYWIGKGISLSDPVRRDSLLTVASRPGLLVAGPSTDTNTDTDTLLNTARPLR